MEDAVGRIMDVFPSLSPVNCPIDGRTEDLSAAATQGKAEEVMATVEDGWETREKKPLYKIFTTAVDTPSEKSPSSSSSCSWSKPFLAVAVVDRSVRTSRSVCELSRSSSAFASASPCAQVLGTSR